MARCILVNLWAVHALRPVQRRACPAGSPPPADIPSMQNTAVLKALQLYYQIAEQTWCWSSRIGLISRRGGCVSEVTHSCAQVISRRIRFASASVPRPASPASAWRGSNSSRPGS